MIRDSWKYAQLLKTRAWYIMKTRAWYIMKTRAWYIMKTRAWYIMKTRAWYIMDRKFCEYYLYFHIDYQSNWKNGEIEQESFRAEPWFPSFLCYESLNKVSEKAMYPYPCQVYFNLFLKLLYCISDTYHHNRTPLALSGHIGIGLGHFSCTLGSRIPRA